MCVSLCLANIGAKWSIWNWILSNAFLTLVSGLYVLYSHFPLFQPGVSQLGKQFVWAAGWLGSAHGVCLLAGSWQVISSHTCSARNHKRLLWLYPWKGRLVADMFALCSLFVVVQELKNGLTPIQWEGETLPWTTADSLLEGGKGYWVGR